MLTAKQLHTCCYNTANHHKRWTTCSCIRTENVQSIQTMWFGVLRSWCLIINCGEHVEGCDGVCVYSEQNMMQEVQCGNCWLIFLSTLRIVNEAPCSSYKHHAIINSALRFTPKHAQMWQNCTDADEQRSQARVHWLGLTDTWHRDRQTTLKESLKDYERIESAPLSLSLHGKSSRWA